MKFLIIYEENLNFHKFYEKRKKRFFHKLWSSVWDFDRSFLGIFENFKILENSSKISPSPVKFGLIKIYEMPKMAKMTIFVEFYQIWSNSDL